MRPSTGGTGNYVSSPRPQISPKLKHVLGKELNEKGVEKNFRSWKVDLKSNLDETLESIFTKIVIKGHTWTYNLDFLNEKNGCFSFHPPTLSKTLKVNILACITYSILDIVRWVYFILIVSTFLCLYFHGSSLSTFCFLTKMLKCFVFWNILCVLNYSGGLYSKQKGSLEIKVFFKELFCYWSTLSHKALICQKQTSLSMYSSNYMVT